MKVYALYFDKSKCVLEIAPFNKYFNSKIEIDEVTKFNDCIYLCSDRKKLREKAKEIKQGWIDETKETLAKFEGLKVKNKY